MHRMASVSTNDSSEMREILEVFEEHSVSVQQTASLLMLQTQD